MRFILVQWMFMNCTCFPMIFIGHISLHLTMNVLPEIEQNLPILSLLSSTTVQMRVAVVPRGLVENIQNSNPAGRKYSAFSPHLLLLPNFLAGIIFPSVSKAALYSDLANFLPNSSQHGHCCKFLGEKQT